MAIAHLLKIPSSTVYYWVHSGYAERQRARHRALYRKDPDGYQKRATQYRKKNVEKVREYKRNYSRWRYQTDPVERRRRNIASKKWAENHPDKIREYARQKYWREKRKQERIQLIAEGIKKIIEEKRNESTHHN